MPTTNNSDSVALSISSRLHNFTKSGAPWIVTLSSSDFHKNLEFSFVLKAAWSAKVKFASYWVIIDVAQTYRIPSDSLFITTLSIIETYLWAWECACIAHLYWNWYDAIGFVTSSLIQWFNSFMSSSVGSSSDPLNFHPLINYAIGTCFDRNINHHFKHQSYSRQHTKLWQFINTHFVF